MSVKGRLIFSREIGMTQEGRGYGGYVSGGMSVRVYMIGWSKGGQSPVSERARDPWALQLAVTTVILLFASLCLLLLPLLLLLLLLWWLWWWLLLLLSRWLWWLLLLLASSNVLDVLDRMCEGVFAARICEGVCKGVCDIQTRCTMMGGPCRGNRLALVCGVSGCSTGAGARW